MTDNNIVVVDAKELVTPIGALNQQLEQYLVGIGLPTESVVAPLDDRKTVVTQLAEIIDLIPQEERIKSLYLSRFTIAIAAGLFDGALNYLWDETVRALRKQIISFDVQYFYSIAEKINSRYRNLSKEEDIDQVSEHDLLEGCRRLGLVSDVNYERLEHVNYMRNHASAAHPNNNEVDGYEILSMLSVCLKHAITAKPDLALISIKSLLINIRTQVIPESDYSSIGQELVKQPQERINDFLWSIFGQYTDLSAPEQLKENIKGIAPYVWNASTEDRKYEIGAKYGLFRNNGDVAKKDACNNFLEVVSGLKYKDEDSLAAELIEKLGNLYRAHFGTYNFYNEYPHAQALTVSLPPTGIVPRAARLQWTKIISICYIGNGYGYREGVDEQALPYYTDFIKKFSEAEVIEFIKLFQDPEFTAPLSRTKPDRRVRNLANFLKTLYKNVYIHKVLDLIIKAPTATLNNLYKTTDYKSAIQNV